MRLLRRAARIALLLIASTQRMWAQYDTQPADASETLTVFPHPDTNRLWLSGQMNIIFQTHPAFPAAYTGDHSLRPTYETATSSVLTLFTGFRLTDRTEALFDLESAGGRGISDAFGLAGFTDLDVVRNPTLGAAPYVARVMLHQSIPLGVEQASAEPTPLSLANTVPVRRLEWRVGKFGTADFFDLNAVGSDSHLQFMNWTVDNTGGYDYAADTRGYTWGGLIEYHDRRWALRFGEMMMPKFANGIELEWNLARARAENIEADLQASILQRAMTIRLVAYVNHADMGDYQQAVQRFESGIDPLPTIEATRQQGRIKYGFGVNADQQVTPSMRAFVRWGWNEPHHESFAYTEVNDTIAIGADYSGQAWRRAHDRLGGALVSNGISEDHQTYLRLGGKGFLLGDGGLNYGREQIAEVYYTAHLWRGVFTSADVQPIVHPGYNRDRGPVFVAGLRLHVDF